MGCLPSHVYSLTGVARTALLSGHWQRAWFCELRSRDVYGSSKGSDLMIHGCAWVCACWTIICNGRHQACMLAESVWGVQGIR